MVNDAWVKKLPFSDDIHDVITNHIDTIVVVLHF